MVYVLLLLLRSLFGSWWELLSRNDSLEDLDPSYQILLPDLPSTLPKKELWQISKGWMQTTVQTMPPCSQPVSDLYWSSISLQCSSTELVVYSARVHQVVVVTWYVSVGHSNPSTPTSDIPGQREMVHISFLIIFEIGSADTASSGAAFVPSSLAAPLHARSCIAKMGLWRHIYCTDFPPKCGFRGKFLSSPKSILSDHLFLVNLTNIYGSALLTSEYPHLPTLGMPGIAIASLPNLNIFQHQEESPTLTTSCLPFRAPRHLNQVLTLRAFVGNMSLSILVRNRKQGHSCNLVYFFLCSGNQTLTRPIAADIHLRYQPYSIDQSAVRAHQRSTMDLEAATLALHAVAVRRQHATTSSAATHIIKKRKPASFFIDSEMGPSATALSSGPIQPESQELEAIAKLRRGEGVSPFEFLGLIEQCGICKLFFTGGVLRCHIFVCPSSKVWLVLVCFLNNKYVAMYRPFRFFIEWLIGIQISFQCQERSAQGVVFL